MMSELEAILNTIPSCGTVSKGEGVALTSVLTALALLIAANAGLCAAAAPAAGLERFYIGTYTEASSLGIYQSGLDLGSRTLTAAKLAATTTDPSFLALHPTGRFLYAVNEGGGAVVAFSADRATGGLTRLNQQSSGGAAPCHLVVDDSGKNVLVANYTGGSVTVFPIVADGRLGVATAHIQHPGSGPHAHCIALDAGNQFALVCDLGLDRIFSYRFSSTQGTLTTNSIPWTSVATGSGPRHLVFDPSFARAYVICELNSTIIAFHYDPEQGVLSAFQTVTTLPMGWNGVNAAAEIAVHPSGRFLYESNRSYNSIAVFSMDAGTGELTLVQQQLVGQTPRQFAIDPTGAFCVVANQDSDSILVYSIDPQNGKLTSTGQTVRVSKPVCLLPILTQPPQPVLTLQPTPVNTLSIEFSNSVTSLAYQLDHASSLQGNAGWSVLAIGARGQTSFTVTNALPSEFFRASALTNSQTPKVNP